MGVAKEHASPGHRVEVGRPHDAVRGVFPGEPGQQRGMPAPVVGEEKQDVGSGRRLGRGATGGRQAKARGQEQGGHARARDGHGNPLHGDAAGQGRC